MVKNLKAFLNDSEITEKGKFSMFGDTVDRVGIETSSAWGLLLCNLVYTSEFNWWVKNILFLRTYSPDEILSMLDDSMSQNSRSHIVSAFKNIFISNTILGSEIGMGKCEYEIKGGKGIGMASSGLIGRIPIPPSFSMAFTNLPRHVEAITSSL